MQEEKIRPGNQEKRPIERSSSRRNASRIALAVLYMVAGVLHFAIPGPYIHVMPPFLPEPRLLVAVSGVCEFLGGAGVLIPQTRRFAGYGLIALLLAVFPANITMFYQQWRPHGWTLYTFVLLLRLPLQIPLILWARSVSLNASPVLFLNCDDNENTG